MGVRVTVNHLRAAHMCGRGARPWFARNGLSWDVFITEGYDSDILRATGDALALKVVALAEAEAANGQ
jgi:hypothetical protein